MRRELILLVFIFNALTALAQTGKGNFLIGGNVTAYGVSRGQRKDFSISVSPNAGYFVIKGLAAGVNPYVNLSNSEFALENQGTANFQFKSKSASYGISPFIRYYLMTGNKTSFFGYARGGYNYRKVTDETVGGVAGRQVRNYTYTTPSMSVGPGFAYFLNRNVALEALLTYNAERISSSVDNTNTENSYSNLTFNIGLQVFLGKK